MLKIKGSVSVKGGTSARGVRIRAVLLCGLGHTYKGGVFVQEQRFRVRVGFCAGGTSVQGCYFRRKREFSFSF